MKKNIKKGILFFFILMLIIVSFLFLNKKDIKEPIKKEENNEKEVIIKAEGIKDEACDTNKKIYIEKNGLRYYLVCLTDVKVKLDSKEYTLKDAIEKDYIKMDDLINKMSSGEAIPAISSTIYKFQEDDIKNLSIIHCNTQDGNMDYYIGDSSLEYKKGICERTCNFTRTYHILSVVPNENNEYYDVTLTTYDGTDIATITVKKELMEKYKMNDAYEFTFKKDELDYIQNDSISSLFNTFIVSKIERTEKEKENEIKDEICKIK